MFHLRDVSPAALWFVDLDGESFSLDAETLADLSLEARDALSGQRRPDAGWQPGDTIRTAEAAPDGWAVTLASGQRLGVTHERLQAFRDPHAWQIARKPWTAAEAGGFPVHDYRRFLEDDDIRRLALLQLAARGFVRLSGAPAIPGEIETLAPAFGCLRETNYGRIFDVRTKVDAANLADTALALAAHTDNPYRLSPPDVQILHCLSTAGEGGRSLLVDGLAVTEALRRDAPADFDLLRRVPVRFAWADGTTRLEAVAPVLALNADGALERIRYNPRSMQKALARDDDQNTAWRSAFARLSERLSAPETCLAFDLKPGDMVLMDNRRVLHGRTAFTPDGVAVRHLQGAYADMDGVHSTLRRLTEAKASRDLDALEALFADDRLSQAYGEAISIRDHMLQAAEGAVARRKGPELAAAALLHDIGWGMDGAHETAGADYLSPMLGEGVAGLIRNHVDAKRYLVAARPDYLARLSAASIETLHRQGGPMTEAECHAFEARADFDLSLELRILDDDGKALRAPATGFADYRPLLKALLVRHALLT
ncbi:TauD/TfdA family dioxygenase [Asticcacaulis solisilvae]|uniref:TauD/TfdA family dioxygenase n=1 Tax=Asticcacaulis solisilvae TaxID=1217274 RepID=UPI003FD72A6D